MKDFIKEYVSIGKDVWNDLTTLGKWTIGIPLVIIVYVVILMMIPPLLLVAGIFYLIGMLVKRYPVLNTKIFSKGLLFKNKDW